MSESDRGAYTPRTDAPLAFDARQPVRGGGGPAPVMLILSALVLIALVVAIIMFYRSGVREAGQPPRTVGEPVGQMKTAPPAEAQPADPAAGLQIYQSEDGEAAPATPNFTAPPEQPQARPVTVQPPPRPAPSGGPIAAAPMAPAASPSLKPAIQPATPAPAAPVAKTTPPPAAAPAAKPAPAAAGGAAAVQIGAFSSQALADKEWSEAVRLAPGKGKKVEAVQKGSSTLFRTQVTGFGSRAEASAFCEKLKATGKNCFVK